MCFEEIKKVILAKLSHELPRNLYYHGLPHTLSVMNAALAIAREENVEEKDLLLLHTAALFHDTGFLIKYYDNEPEGAKFAHKLLPSYGYEPDDIKIICNMILATSIPQHPVTLLEKILCDADLDYLGRDDFYTISHELRREWMEYGKPHALPEWYEQQLAFMNKHAYFTATAKRLRVEKKQKHIDEIILLLSSSNKIFKKVQETDVLKKIPDKTHILNIDILSILKNIELFAASNEKVLSDIGALLKILHIPTSENIIEKGEPGNCMYIIYEGNVKVHDDIYTIAELGPGKFFGELSLLDTEPRSASVTATTQCTLLRLDQDDFYTIFRKYNEVAREIMKVLINRLRNQNTSIVNEFKTREKKLRSLVDERTLELREATENLEQAFNEIEEKNSKLEFAYKDIRDSIDYARRIQDSILPLETDMYRIFPESFILYKPKDVISGDFYWFTHLKNSQDKFIVAVADSTGHGVPGAFMSMMGNDLLNHIIIEKGVHDPGKVLTLLNHGIKQALKQTGKMSDTKDGMDIALCIFDRKNHTIHFAGANRSLCFFHFDKEDKINKRELILNEVLPDRTAIGGFTPDDYVFSTYSVDVAEGELIYIFTDGYADQFGGAKNKKFMKKNLISLLGSVKSLPMREQRQILNQHYEEWMGEQVQTDDVLLIGIRYLYHSRFRPARSGFPFIFL